MKLGIIGFPQSGKTTLFNALTRQNTPTTPPQAGSRCTRRGGRARPARGHALGHVQAAQDHLRQGHLRRHRRAGRLRRQRRAFRAAAQPADARWTGSSTWCAASSDNVPHPLRQRGPGARPRRHGRRTAAERPDRRGAQAGAPDRRAQKGRHRQNHQRASDCAVQSAERGPLREKPLRFLEIPPTRSNCSPVSAC